MAVGEARVPLLREERTAHHVQTDIRETEAVHLSRSTSVMTSLVAGAAAGAIAKTVIAPLDRTKINFQTSQSPYTWRLALKWAMRRAKSEGVMSLWRGNSATMARIVPYAAIQFTAHEQYKRVLGVDTPNTARSHKMLHLVAGSLAGVTSQSATYPLDIARARMAVTDAREYSSLRVVFYKMIREEGICSLYRGYVATVLGVIPYAGVSFFTYETLKHKYLERVGSPQGGVVNVLFGGAAGALAQTTSYPLDIVRRRIQTSRPVLLSEAPLVYQHSTVRDTLVYVYRTEGWRGFFKGLSMNWVKGPIAVGISFATYDAIKNTLRHLAVHVNR